MLLRLCDGCTRIYNFFFVELMKNEGMKEKMGSSQNASQRGCISYKHNEIEKYNLTIHWK